MTTTHGWELWCDGKWYFTGACEPLMILNKGWFTNASSRAMMVHSRLFDLFPAEGEDVIGKEGAAVMLNQTARYARVKTVSVKVTDKEGAAVKGAQVQFLVLNMGEYFPMQRQRQTKMDRFFSDWFGKCKSSGVPSGNGRICTGRSGYQSAG